MVAAWKESAKLKDLKIEELNFQLGQANAQLERARSNIEELSHQLSEATSRAASAEAALVTFREKAAAQLEALDSQLKSKDMGLAAAEVRAAALEAELKSANSKAQSLMRQVELSETECGRLQEALRTASARASQQQAELAAQQDALQTAARRAEALQVGPWAFVAGCCRAVLKHHHAGHVLAVPLPWDSTLQQTPACRASTCFLAMGIHQRHHLALLDSCGCAADPLLVTPAVGAGQRHRSPAGSTPEAGRAGGQGDGPGHHPAQPHAERWRDGGGGAVARQWRHACE